MNKENIPVITDRKKLYDKCENMEQLFDKYYLPLLDKHYSKTYELRQENQKYKEVIDKATNELFILKDMIYKPETREENFEIQRKIAITFISFIKYFIY